MSQQPTQIRKSHPFAETVRRTAAKVVRDTSIDTSTKTLVHPANISMVSGASASNNESSPGIIATVEKYGAALATEDVSRARLVARGGTVLQDDGTAVEISTFGLLDWGHWIG